MADQKKFTLILKTPKGILQVEVPIGAYTLGRNKNAHIVLNDHRVSSAHARLVVTSTSLFIIDLDSTNGTYVNGEKITPETETEIDDQTIVDIDPFEFRIISEKVKTRSSRKKSKAGTGEGPPTPPIDDDGPLDPMDGLQPPPGLDIYSERLMGYLPEIYHSVHINGSRSNDDPNDFLARFLGIFEAILFPIEWTADNFDLFLHPTTVPKQYLIWLANWYGLSFDATWSNKKKREFVQHAYEIFAMRGTKWALSRILEIYTGVQPEIRDLEEGKNRSLFTIILPLRKDEVNLEIVQQLIDEHKPVHTSYELKVRKG